jgi:hypothetical protein
MIAIVFSGMLIQAQVLVNEKSINEMDVQFVELVVAIKGQPTTGIIYIDYGQYNFYWEVLPKNNPIQIISDTSSKDVNNGNTMIIFNLMIKNGWEFISSSTLSQTNSHQVRYLMKKK